ncbi:MAG: phenylalanine--tRNA ligase subunit beta [Patescibacteria group bacterium]
MKISYNWLKQYIPKAPDANKLVDIFNYHLCEVETAEKKLDGDVIFDLKILPNRAHDLLSHQGVARELASLLNIKYVDPTPKYKIPESKSTNLLIEIKIDKCPRYMGRIIRSVKVGSSPDWVVKHLESIGQRSINNIVDAANIVMFDCGQPTHAFDLDKIKGGIMVRDAQAGEEIVTLDNKEIKLKNFHLVIADSKNVLALAGIKGGKIAEVDENTKNIIIEVANFDPMSVRKTAQALNIFTDARKRFENNLSPELGSYAMRELSALIFEMCPGAIFEDIVDTYPKKQKEKKLSFSANRISDILGLDVSVTTIKDILKRYNFTYDLVVGVPLGTPTTKFLMTVPPMRLDLEIEEDMAEEMARILGYDKIKGNIPKISFKPKQNETYAKICWAKNRLLSDGYFEVMTYTFCDKGEVEVQNSASDKKFLRTNLTDGLKESSKLNQLNALFLGINQVKIFEIGTIFKKTGEEMHIAYGDKKEIKETTLEEFVLENSSSKEHGYFSAEKFLVLAPSRFQVSFKEDFLLQKKNKNSSLKPLLFQMWSLFPFIARDIAVWVPENVKSSEVKNIIKKNMGDMVIRGPELFDEFKKGNQISYAFRLVFQSYDRTLTDIEVNENMIKITNKIKENNDWQVR